MKKKKHQSKSVYPARLRKIIQDALPKYTNIFNVSQFKGKVVFDETDKKEHGPLAEINVDRRYLEAEVRIFTRIIGHWKEGGDEAVENVVAHEVAHILTQHVRDLADEPYKTKREVDDAWEGLTEVIARLGIDANK